MIDDAKTNRRSRVPVAGAMAARKAETYSPDTYVIDLAELRQIIFELQHESEQEAS